MKTKTKKPSHEETAIAMVVTCIVAGHVVKAWGPDGDFTVGPYHKAVGEPTFALFGYGRRVPEPYQAREGSAQDMARMFVASCVGSTRAREAARKIGIPFSSAAADISRQKSQHLMYCRKQYCKECR